MAKSAKQPLYRQFSSKPLSSQRLTTMYQTMTRNPLNLEEVKRPIGQLHLIPERCKDCTYCVEFCPNDVLIIGEQMNTRGYQFPTVREGKEESCVDCKSCMDRCPEFAIFTTEVNGK